MGRSLSRPAAPLPRVRSTPAPAWARRDSSTLRVLDTSWVAVAVVPLREEEMVALKRIQRGRAAPRFLTRTCNRFEVAARVGLLLGFRPATAVAPSRSPAGRAFDSV